MTFVKWAMAMIRSLLSIIVFLIGATIGLLIHLWAGIAGGMIEWWFGVRELWKSI